MHGPEKDFMLHAFRACACGIKQKHTVGPSIKLTPVAVTLASGAVLVSEGSLDSSKR